MCLPFPTEWVQKSPTLWTKQGGFPKGVVQLPDGSWRWGSRCGNYKVGLEGVCATAEEAMAAVDAATREKI